MDASPPGAARFDPPLRAPAQRPRHGGRGGRAGGDGRRRPRGRLPVRQRRAHRQRGPGHAGAQPVLAGHRSGAGLLARQRRGAHVRRLYAAAGAPAPSVRGRPGLHRVLGLAPGRHQERLCGAEAGCHLGDALSADRPGRRGPHLRFDHSRQQPVGQGRHRLSAGKRLWHRDAAPAAGGVQQHRAAADRCQRPRSHRRRHLGAVPGDLSAGRRADRLRVAPARGA